MNAYGWGWVGFAIYFAVLEGVALFQFWSGARAWRGRSA